MSKEQLTPQEFLYKQAVRQLESQLASGTVYGLHDEVRQRGLLDGKKWNLDLVHIYSHEENDFSMSQYWSPVDGWEYADPKDADVQARRVLADKYEQLDMLPMLPATVSRKIERHTDVTGRDGVAYYDDVQVPLERIIDGSAFDHNGTPTWKGSGPKSFGEGMDYLNEEGMRNRMVDTTHKGVAIEYALRHYGRAEDWDNSLGRPVVLTPFIDSDGEVWFTAHNGNTRIIADKLVGQKTIDASVEILKTPDGQVSPSVYNGSIIEELTGRPK